MQETDPKVRQQLLVFGFSIVIIFCFLFVKNCRVSVRNRLLLSGWSVSSASSCFLWNSSASVPNLCGEGSSVVVSLEAIP